MKTTLALLLALFLATPAYADGIIVMDSNGGLPSLVSRYLRPAGGLSVSEVKFKMPIAATIAIMYIRAKTGPGGSKTDTFTLRKNGVDTDLTVGLTGSATSANVTANVDFSAGDDLSIRVDTALLTASDDVIITLGL